MPRWPEGHVLKTLCPVCGGTKARKSRTCLGCRPAQKPLLGRRGPAHPTWRGGQQIDRDGYTRTWAPDHPYPRRAVYVLEHVRVMELHLGRRLQSGELVHHINGDKADNRLENLQVMSWAEHSRYHRRGDREQRIARAKARTHCVYGHPYTDENTYLTKSGSRVCCACRLKSKRAYNARQRAIRLTRQATDAITVRILTGEEGGSC